MGGDADDEDEIDFAVAAHCRDGSWTVSELKPSLGHDLEKLAEALGRLSSDVGVLGLVSVNEDYFVVVRRDGTGMRVVLSDVTAIEESDLASDVADLLDLPDVEDDEDPRPAGDLDLLADLGVSAAALIDLCEDDESLPEDLLLDLAEQLGFGDELESVLE